MSRCAKRWSCTPTCGRRKTIKGVRAPFDDIDLVVVRENMEDMYAGIEFDAGKPETTEVIAAINELATRRSIAIGSDQHQDHHARMDSQRSSTFAFDYARENKRKKVTIVHKANIMKFTDGLFLQVAQEVAGEYPDIESTTASSTTCACS